MVFKMERTLREKHDGMNQFVVQKKICPKYEIFPFVLTEERPRKN